MNKLSMDENSSTKTRSGPSEHFALYREAGYALGLAAQIGFGLMPLLQIRLEAN
jgi:hypothetical protein